MEPNISNREATELAGPHGRWVYRTDRPLQVVAVHVAEFVVLLAFFVGLVFGLTVVGSVTTALHEWLAGW